MCRLVAYLGPNTLLREILVDPSNSIISQSLHARESKTFTNGDGFGIGWYAPHISTDPGLFTSLTPAWSNRNLLNLAAKIESPCFFAHVRAASSGGVSSFNCHPFIYKNWMLMHNGGINDFLSIKRHIRHLLDDDIYQWVKGETDSEHLFALFIQRAKGKDLSNLNTVADLMKSTFEEINELVNRYSEQDTGGSFYNICLTDGTRLLASRYCTDTKDPPESLHYITESSLLSRSHRRRQQNKQFTPKFILVASEKLNTFRKDWHYVPANHLMLIDKTQEVSFCPL